MESKGVVVVVEDPTRIFDPFFTTKEMGWGVGLSVCPSIIQSHEGELWAESAGDQGTKFWVTLPIGPSPDTAD
jgi:signal transduction histidine kinase